MKNKIHELSSKHGPWCDPALLACYWNYAGLATTTEYFFVFIDLTSNNLGHYMFLKSEIDRFQDFQTACFGLRYQFLNYIKCRQAANLHIREAGPRECLFLLLIIISFFLSIDSYNQFFQHCIRVFTYGICF